MTSNNQRGDGFPPRGGGGAGARAYLPNQTWADPRALDRRWDWSHGKLLLGMCEGQPIAEPDRVYPRAVRGDDRHIVTIAGSRAGKSSTVLIPNLKHYPGSALVIDPKGELAQATARLRNEKFGQDVAVLDPFGTVGTNTNTYNPLDELDAKSATFVDDIGLVADALIIATDKDTHWTDAAKNFIRGCLLYMFVHGDATLPRLRRIILGDEGFIKIPDSDDDPDNLLLKMHRTDSFNGLLSLIAQTMLEKNKREFESVVSVAREQLSFLDSAPLGTCLRSSSIRLNRMKSQPTTIYLCLPATRLATHSKWLRVILSLALVELERDRTEPEFPVLLMLEEFAALGYLKSIEFASGFMAGFGVRLWPILQDISQLKTHYKNSWETFLGNAGTLQVFGNTDYETTEYVSKLLGNTNVVERQEVFTTSAQRAQGDPGIRDSYRQTRLIQPEEITRYFARETNRQIIFVPGFQPIFASRLVPEK